MLSIENLASNYKVVLSRSVTLLSVAQYSTHIGMANARCIQYKRHHMTQTHSGELHMSRVSYYGAILVLVTSVRNELGVPHSEVTALLGAFGEDCDGRPGKEGGRTSELSHRWSMQILESKIILL